MREIRISRGERYSSDFQPDERFSPDRTAILIYAADAVSGGTVRDLSGHGNDGRVKWF